MQKTRELLEIQLGLIDYLESRISIFEFFEMFGKNKDLRNLALLLDKANSENIEELAKIILNFS